MGGNFQVLVLLENYLMGRYGHLRIANEHTCQRWASVISVASSSRCSRSVVSEPKIRISRCKPRKIDGGGKSITTVITCIKCKGAIASKKEKCGETTVSCEGLLNERPNCYKRTLLDFSCVKSPNTYIPAFKSSVCCSLVHTFHSIPPAFHVPATLFNTGASHVHECWK